MTASVDYKIKSFGKRVVRDKSFPLSLPMKQKKGKVVLSRSHLRAIHQLVNPFRGPLGKVIKTENAFIVLKIRFCRLKDKNVFNPPPAPSFRYSLKNLLKYSYDTLINCFN